jgi:indolepyruvate ferredoxin oxidoreductase
MHRKISLGPWARPALRLLVAMRRLRGTPLDPFGQTGVRRVERALITEYRDLVTRTLDALTRGNLTTAVEIAGLPDMIRGYEEIKLGSVRAYHERMAVLAAEFPAGGRAGG